MGQTNTARSSAANEYEQFDDISDSDCYQNSCVEKLLPTIKEKMGWINSVEVIVESYGSTYEEE